MRVILFVFLALAMSLGYCAPSFASTQLAEQNFPLSSLVIDKDKIPRGDSYTSSEHREKFWSIHEKFGFLTNGDRTLLLARNLETAKNLVNDLMFAKKIWDDQTFSPPKIERNVSRKVGDKTGYFVDVTLLIPKIFGALNEQYAKIFGSNCWNLALYLNGAASNLQESTPAEFRAWVESDQVRRVDFSESVLPGDVIVFRLQGEEVHAAVILTPGIVLTKNGQEESRPYRIMDFQEMAAQYFNVHPIFGTRNSDEWFVVRKNNRAVH